MRGKQEALDLLTESRRALEVLTRLVTRLEGYTQRLETELDRRIEEEVSGLSGSN